MRSLQEVTIANFLYLNGIDYAYETMKRIRNEAVALLEGFPPSETVDALISILDYTIEREK